MSEKERLEYLLRSIKAALGFLTPSANPLDVREAREILETAVSNVVIKT